MTRQHESVTGALRRFLLRASPGQVVTALLALAVTLPAACLLWALLSFSGGHWRELLCAKALPSQLLPGQATPPCPEPLQSLPNGGCWQQIKASKEACERDWYEWNGTCWAPAFKVEHPGNAGRARQVRTTLYKEEP